MAHNFTIGRPTTERVEYGDREKIQPTVEPVTTSAGEDPVHTDPYEVESDAGSGRRRPSFRVWSETTRAFPEFQSVWYSIREYASEEYEPSYIPVSLYTDDLPAVEDAVLSALDDDDLEPYAQRVLWFCRWSQYAYEQHGGMAVFQSGEPLAMYQYRA